MKKYPFLAALLSLVLILAFITACSDIGVSSTPAPTTGEISPTPGQTPTAASPEPTPSAPVSGNGTLSLGGAVLSFDSGAAYADGKTLVITAAGSYTLSGTVTDGQIIVEASKDDKVTLILAGASVTCSDSAAIWVRSADKVTLYLTENTENSVSDGAAYSTADEPNAAIYSKDDLTIEGGGSLTVSANYNNGIQSSNDIRIKSGTVTVTSVNHGIKGKDSVRIDSGTVTVTSGGDGLKSDNDEETDRGFILINGGVITVDSGEDGVQAENYILVEGGTLNITSAEDGFNAVNDITVNAGVITVDSEQDAFDSDGTLNVKNGTFKILSAGGSANSSSSAQTGFWGGGFGGRPGGQQFPQATPSAVSDVSAKGLKAAVSVTIDGGVFELDTADDAIHSNGDVTVNGGSFTIASGDDGMHADSALTLNGGTIIISKSYEGLEGSEIYLNGGSADVTASDDGVNAAGGNDGSSLGGRPGMGGFSRSTGSMTISGGVWTVSSAGDGLDCNGSIVMTGGGVTVYGPTNSGNGALDYDGSFKMSGGTLLASGAYGMAQSVTPSGLCCASIVVSSGVQAGKTVSVRTEGGEELFSVTSPKSWQSLVIAGAELVQGQSYNVYSDGSLIGRFTQSSASVSVRI